MKKLTKVQAELVVKAARFGWSKTQALKEIDAAEAKAAGITKKEAAELAAEISKKRSARIKEKLLWALPLVLKKKLRTSLEAKLSKRFQKGFSYRQPSSDWVDVYNSVAVKLRTGEPSELIVQQYTVYHEKHNWKANQTNHLLCLNPLDDFTTEGGLLTVFRKGNPEVCFWYEQSRGFEVKRVDGYFVRGYHIEAESLKDAKAKVAAKIKKAKAEAAKRKALEELQDSLELNAKLVNREFGFCMAGIRQFCERNGIDATASITLKELRAKVVANRNVNCAVYATYLNKLGIKLNCE